ncbi:hypothetical protein SCMU_40390 [Sinomonas cyclohexanicum]|uniref:Alkaline phosphatase n=1 Tax=Sinomonas cyclohexanicum TaxID=322009 RepID=A0ABM7Q0U3_SINCY|nr:alkaline phosphatase [Corynebacterium cyclohexanicum]BCT78197.1 hypothetical protein SCMU_40390 [Corynebacterium cyclohexanicum]
MKRTIAALASACAVGAIIATSVGAGTAGPASAAPAANDGRIKNVIYLLGDGMGRTHVTAGRERFYGADGRMVMETLPSHGFVSTYAAEKNSAQPGQPGFAPNYVTDSASAATAWASGVNPDRSRGGGLIGA